MKKNKLYFNLSYGVLGLVVIAPIVFLLLVKNQVVTDTVDASDNVSVLQKIVQSGNAKSIAKEVRSINLPVPFTSQAPEKNWDQPWQDACEEAAILMLDAYDKKYTVSPSFARDEILKMVAYEDKRSWGYSIEAVKMKELMQFYIGKKKTVKIFENPKVEDLRTLLRAGKPLLALVYGKGLKNPYFTDGGPTYHALIIRGYNADGFFTNDPGTKRGENFFYKTDVIMKSLHDWNGGAVLSGKPVVLYLE